MSILEEEKAQGALEYMLIVAAALGIVAIAIATITNIAERAEEIAENKIKEIENILGYIK